MSNERSPELLPRINWRYVYKVARGHGWTDTEICRRMGIKLPHFSEVKHGKRPVTMPFATCLSHVMQCTYDPILVHPTQTRIISAREAMTLAHLEDGRLWPAGAKDIAMGKYRRYLSKKQVAEAISPTDIG